MKIDRIFIILVIKNHHKMTSLVPYNPQDISLAQLPPEILTQISGYMRTVNIQSIFVSKFTYNQFIRYNKRIPSNLTKLEWYNWLTKDQNFIMCPQLCNNMPFITLLYKFVKDCYEPDRYLDILKKFGCNFNIMTIFDHQNIKNTINFHLNTTMSIYDYPESCIYNCGCFKQSITFEPNVNEYARILNLFKSNNLDAIDNNPILINFLFLNFCFFNPKYESKVKALKMDTIITQSDTDNGQVIISNNYNINLTNYIVRYLYYHCNINGDDQCNRIFNDELQIDLSKCYQQNYCILFLELSSIHGISYTHMIDYLLSWNISLNDIILNLITFNHFSTILTFLLEQNYRYIVDINIVMLNNKLHNQCNKKYEVKHMIGSIIGYLLNKRMLGKGLDILKSMINGPHPIFKKVLVNIIKIYKIDYINEHELVNNNKKLWVLKHIQKSNTRPTKRRKIET